MLDSIKESYGITDIDSFAVFQWADDQIQVLDSVPVSFGEMTYRYIIENKDRDTLHSFQTNKYQSPKELIPTIKIQEKPGWETIYNKAWDLCWQRIRTSKVLPSRFAYNDYPDNNNTYVWDAAFCNLYQAYTEVHGGHPGILTYDGFYHISQNYNTLEIKQNEFSRIISGETDPAKITEYENEVKEARQAFRTSLSDSSLNIDQNVKDSIEKQE